MQLNPILLFFVLAPVVATPNDAELARYRKQRQWIQECKSRPFPLWLINQLMAANSASEKRVNVLIDHEYTNITFTRRHKDTFY